MGGLWQDVAHSTRPICRILKTIARADPSVALVSSMHPAVLSFWLSQPDAPAATDAAWREQRRQVAQAALDGAWWGTITSEPGSGGDISRTRALADPQPDGTYRISGQKHFGSGSGITSYMITTALPQGESGADYFFLDVRNASWDGSGGMKLTAEWDGHGMIATQSHAFEFQRFPATRIAWPGNMDGLAAAAAPFIASLFVSVVVGVVESAVETARGQLLRRKDGLRPYEQVEWAQVETESWLIAQAYEGLMASVEARGSGAALEALLAKTAIAQLAECVTGRICRVMGGGTFSQSSPFGNAFEDVRALGCLRPPWALAFDSILERTWERYG
jgi:alkylation response protein AidB-like acyl-CoA dehydrogenase